MADKSTFVGARLRVSTNEGDYEGTVHSIDIEKRKVTLSKVVSCSTGRKLHGFHNFFGHELTTLELLEEANNNAAQDQAAENGQRHDTKEEKQLYRENSDMASNHSSQTSSKMGRGFGGRGVAKAFTDAGIGINSKLGVKKTAVSSGSFSRDVSDEGDSLLKRQPIIAEKYLSDVTLDEEAKENLSPNVLPDIVPIDSFGKSFEEAVEFISKQRVIGVCCEGVDLGRLGKLCWLVIGCSKVIYLFDVLTLGAPCFDEGLQDILESGDLLKVFHDCRLASDALFHQYHIHLMNVYDTQVADAIIYKNERGGELPRYVNGLVACLYEYLNLSPENVSFQKVRQKFMKTNASIWAVRPAPEALVDAAAKHVMYLRELRLAQMERLMAEFLYGVDIYLSIARDSKELNPKVKGQLLPAKFKELNHFNYRHRSRRYDGDFHEDARGVVPEDVLASREAWCEGDKFTHAYENKRGRVKETVNRISTPVDRLKEKWRESGSDSDGSNITSESSGFSMEAAAQNQGAAAVAVKSSSVSIPPRQENIRQEIFSEKDFPPLSSPDSEGVGTPPRQKKEKHRPHLQAERRMEANVRETTHALGPGLQSDSAELPSLLLQRANALSRESASLPGRGRAGALLRHAALPDVRLPAGYGGSGYYHNEASGADRYDAIRNEFHFPPDEELLTAPEVVPVANHHLVRGTTVRIRKT